MGENPIPIGVPVEDELVGLVDLGELTPAAPEEEQVGDQHGAWEQAGWQAVGGGQVMLAKHLLAEPRAALGASGEEATGDEEHAESVGSEQVERATEEVGVGLLLAVSAVRILGEGGAAGSVRWVGQHEVDLTGVLSLVRADPALEGAFEHVVVGVERAQHAGRER